MKRVLYLKRVLKFLFIDMDIFSASGAFLKDEKNRRKRFNYLRLQSKHNEY